ncbi:ABC transporter ATP-binding protein/permease [Sporosarcina sp. ANT_H38]|uniref:ATP-binding cassette domain-containing protein n=1 Tax=Sporosarcina sp. ANT_H38 TaxID=2597358 RepID=UPI0011F1902F|nr:ATP-binding cassette domain-containing protein [Sporosarcina sp. ANT_H38]KAA0944227.1 ABC transporter ATP-binding protein/permease [Sporosarcina sp. ANT_H38]
MFELKNVSKKYNSEFALNNVSGAMGKGIHFIVGASGSGKTTLLKIMSGMEQDFDGDVSYGGKDIKALTSQEKSYFYNNIFGFVWQDFNLLEDLTVLENVVLPQYLKDDQKTKNAEKTLKELKIFDLASQKVKNLSGGQKQRVAIARELMKNPQVIIADEPTSALDEKSAKITMDILRAIAKNRTVIIVTHNTSLIGVKDTVFELDKGELVASTHNSVVKTTELKMENNHKLSFKNAFAVARTSVKRNSGRFAVATLSLMMAALLLLTTLGGTVSSSSQDAFDGLFDTYGEGLLDISIIGSFTSAGGMDGSEDEQPNADVTQDIGGLYDQYASDKRVTFTAFLQALDNISITVDGENYKVASSGSSPVINKLVTGKMPSGTVNEVVVPESFVKSLGIENNQAIGKEIDFSVSMYNWDTGEPVLKDGKINATIVGVADTTVVYEYEGEMMENSVEDSFFFSKAALDDLRNQTEMKGEGMNFLIRAKTPTDMIAIKDELNEQGIVPLGRFELVEDIVRLNSQSAEQSGSASTVIGFLSVVMVIAIFLITGVMRKREYAIYKVSGFNNRHLNLLNAAEMITVAVTAMLLLLVTSPLINKATEALFAVNILNAKMLSTGMFLIVGVAVIAYVTTAIVYVRTNIATALKTGDR